MQHGNFLHYSPTPLNGCLVNTPGAPPTTSSTSPVAVAMVAATANSSNGNGTNNSSAGGGSGSGTGSASSGGSKRDDYWLTLEVCREHLRSKCPRSADECKFAHPPSHIEVQPTGRVICCYDAVYRHNCNRTEPPCKYLHPPQHLKEQLMQNGRANKLIRDQKQVLQLTLQNQLAMAHGGFLPYMTTTAANPAGRLLAPGLPGTPASAGMFPVLSYLSDPTGGQSHTSTAIFPSGLTLGGYAAAAQATPLYSAAPLPATSVAAPLTVNSGLGLLTVSPTHLCNSGNFMEPPKLTVPPTDPSALPAAPSSATSSTSSASSLSSGNALFNNNNNILYAHQTSKGFTQTLNQNALAAAAAASALKRPALTDAHTGLPIYHSPAPAGPLGPMVPYASGATGYHHQAAALIAAAQQQQQQQQAIAFYLQLLAASPGYGGAGLPRF